MGEQKTTKFKKGKDNINCKLTDDDVIYIRDHYIPRHPQFSGVALAKKFGVSPQTINYIVNNKTHKKET